jgi:replicative DNA helicase
MTDPYDHEAERAILGALLAQPSLLASMPLDLEHFHPRHQPSHPSTASVP